MIELSLRSAFSLVELLVVISIIGVLVALLLPGVMAAREAARRAECQHHLHEMGIAAQNHHSVYNRFPTGTTLHPLPEVRSIGWAVFLLPYLEQQAAYDRIRPLPDGSAASFIGGSVFVETFVCPSDRREWLVPLQQKSNYYGVSGAGRHGQYLDLDDAVCGDTYLDGTLYPQSETRIQDITDGTAHTLLVGETAYVFHDWITGTIWYPSTPEERCVYATKNIRYPINASLSEYGCFPADPNCEPASPRMLRNDLFFGSAHPGGAQFVFADGSVQFLHDSIDFTIYQDLSTRNGEEVR